MDNNKHEEISQQMSAKTNSTSGKKSKSKSRSPEKKDSSKTIKSAKSAKSHKSSSSNKSRSPKRKLTSSFKDLNDASLINDAPKSTPELEDLSSLGLTMVNEKIFQKFTLRKLVLSGNNLRSVPSAISNLVNLEHLDLSKNPLKVKDVDDAKCLPLEMRLMKNLKYLSISECNLRYIPTTVWLCVTLKTLDLSRNKISLLVPDIGNLQNLTNLYLSQCNLTTLPAEIGFCIELNEIILMANQIESLPDSLKDCKKLHTLKMSYRSFTSLLDTYMENLISKGQIKSEHVPLVVFELERLKSLNLKHTKINNLPENYLKSLNELYLDNNYFESFSEATLKPMYESLICLTLSNNLLKEIPNEILNLVNLEILDLSSNQINTFPTRFSTVKLKELNLNENNLKAINSSVSILKNLEKLSLARNNITDLNDNLFDLTNLTYLDLSYNKISRISPKICNLKQIQEAHSYIKLNKTGLWVIGNPLEIPPKEIWQTNNIKKIYDFLSNYVQRNLDYIFYSKLIFLGSSGVGKSTLIDCFYNNRNEFLSAHVDHSTIVARKLYKRTINKIEWSILDLGGHEIYKAFHSTFFSSIDHEHEPTIFVLVYNHSEYSNDNHHKHIGSWIESIINNNRPTSKASINIKLIGIEAKGSINKDKVDLVKENCQQTINNYINGLKNEKLKLENLLNNTSLTEENRNSYMNAINLCDLMLKRKLNLINDITIIDSEMSKENVNDVLLSLENQTIKLNKKVPLDLNSLLKVHLPKLHKNRINLDELVDYLSSINDIRNLIVKNKRFDLNIEKVIHYAKTLCDIFWLKFDQNLNKQIYLYYEYILNCLKLFIRHDLKQDLIDKSNNYDKTIFNTCGIFENRQEFLNTIDLFQNYGILQHKLFKYICFSLTQMEDNEMRDSIDLLNEFSIVFKSELEYLEDKDAFEQIVIPLMCKSNFEIEKSKKLETDWDYYLYTDDYEKFFIRLDQIRKYRQEEKNLNSLKKQKNLWNSQEPNFFDDYSTEEPKTVTNETTNIKIEPIKFNIFDENGNYIFVNEQDLVDKYKHKCLIELVSSSNIDISVFDKLSSFVQKFVYERFDWDHRIIARDLNDTIMKIELLNETNCFKILIELKSFKIEYLNEIKTNFDSCFDNLFNNFPGQFFYKNFVSFI